jgi:Na+/melibiose symporter-like transporter
MIFNLGLAAGVMVPLCNIIPILLIRNYNLTRERYALLKNELDAARTKRASSAANLPENPLAQHG